MDTRQCFVPRRIKCVTIDFIFEAYECDTSHNVKHQGNKQTSLDHLSKAIKIQNRGDNYMDGSPQISDDTRCLLEGKTTHAFG